MRRKAQKVLLAILVSAIAAMCGAFAACGDDPSDSPAISVRTSIEITVGGSESLGAQVAIGTEKKEGGEFTYRSADPTVASVSEQGLVRGNKAGKTTLTVSCVYEGATLASVEVEITVKDQGNTPALNPEIFVSFSSVRVAVGGEGRQINAVVMDGERVLAGGAFVYESADTTVATVSDGGMINAVKKGNTTVTVKCTYEGKTLDAVTLPVEIYEEMTVDTHITGNMLELYSGAGRDNEHPFDVTATVAPTVTLSGAEITDAEITLAVTQGDAVTVDGLVITAAKAGEAQVTVTATAKSGTSESVKVNVTVQKPYCTVTFDAQPVICLQKGIDWTVFETPTEVAKTAVTGIKIDGRTVQYEIDDNGILKLDKNCTTGEDLEMQIETADELLNAEVSVATMTVGTRDELRAFAEKYDDYCKSPVNEYIVLTADIDLGESAKAAAGKVGEFAIQWYDGNWHGTNGTGAAGLSWDGTFDGKGHTINDVRLGYGFMQSIGETGVVKNLALTHIEKYGTETGPIAQELFGTVENCYFQGKMIEKQAGAWCTPSVSVMSAGAKIENVAVNFEMNPAADRNGINNAPEGSTVKNLYIISPGHTGNLTGNSNYNKAANGAVYQNAYALRAKLEDLQSKFTSDYWDLSDTLIFSSAKKYFTADTAANKSVNASGDVLPGGSVQLNATGFAAVAWEIKTPDLAASVTEGGMLSVGVQVAHGTDFTVAATGFDRVLGSLYKVEKELTVINAERVSLDGKTVTGVNRNSDVLTVDMTEKNIAQIVSAAYEGKAVTGYKFDAATHEFTLNLKNLTSLGDSELTITAKNADGDYFVYGKQIEKVDFAIGTKAELDQFAAKIKAVNSKAALIDSTSGRYLSAAEYTTAVLTADIDYAGADFSEQTGKVEFVGSFDGRGHTIYNMHNTDVLFPSLNGHTKSAGSNQMDKPTVLKNVAFVNAVVEVKSTNYIESYGPGAFFIYMVNGSVIHDIYLNVTVKNADHAQFAMIRNTIQSGSKDAANPNYSVFGNIVAEVEYDEDSCFKTNKQTAAVTVSQPSGFINVYVVSNVVPTTDKNGGCFSNANTAVPGNKPSGTGKNDIKYRNLNVHYYATREAMMAEVTELPTLAAIAENPGAAPTDPGEDASEEEKTAYQEALAAYNEALKQYNNTVVCEANRYENAYKYLKEHSDGFSSDIWEIVGEEGSKHLVFKSSVPSQSDTFEISTPFADGGIAAGIPIAISAPRASSWRVTTESVADKCVFSSGFMTVDASVAQNTAFTVEATYTDILGEVHTATKEFTVSKTAETKTLSALVYGKNRMGMPIEVQLKDGETPTTVTENGISISFEIGENGKFELASSSFDSFAVASTHEVKIIAISNADIIEYTASLEIYDFAIGSVDEWKAFENGLNAVHAAHTHLRAALIADVNFGGKYTTQRADSDNSFSLDGKGHKMSNIWLDNINCHGFFGDVFGTAGDHAVIKNIIFDGLKVTGSQSGSLFGFCAIKFLDLENIYVKGEWGGGSGISTGSLFGRTDQWEDISNVTITNVVVNVSIPSGKNAICNNGVSLDNVYAITSGSNGSLGGSVKEGSTAALYQTAAAFVAAKDSVTLGDAWELTETELKLFGTTVLTFESNP